MDAASTAINKILHRGGANAENEGKDSATMSKETAPAVEHETIRKQHELREQKVLDRERHQDHYKTTVQPLHEREVMPEKHHHEQANIQHQHINRDHGEAKAKHNQRQGQFKDETVEAEAKREVVQEPTLTSEHTHHHLHETIQPVIERETVMPSVTHKTIPMKETIQEPTLDEGVTINPAMTREEFEAKMRK
ncbi:hypothetical protein F4808DRAFT_465639 [Astrocystis sublimbata]|nr:hypothetical protein F4808DRAFT_465632 [Astrocystis sublimbata]KAI0190584.1 hypothetical protein F4808DRAFT_465639 [Astrocystis sublimbata]